MTLAPTTRREVCLAVRSASSLLPRGAGTKPPLSTPPAGTQSLEMAALQGVLEYDPGELTLTALAGTSLASVVGLLAENHQYLPFDPPLVERGATLGGTVAAGLAGSGRWRFGGVRDFLLGVWLVDGAGELVRGGGKVVKNAAGFDFPKLLIGSLGRLGVLVELTFKVFPTPRARATLRVELPGLDAAVETLRDLSSSPHELEALDLEPPATLWLRLAGLEEALSRRLDRLKSRLEPRGEVTVLEADSAVEHWRRVGELAWSPEEPLIKVPLTPHHIPPLEEKLRQTGTRRYYGGGGHQLWLSLPPDPAQARRLQPLLWDQGLSGIAVLGPRQESGSRAQTAGGGEGFEGTPVFWGRPLGGPFLDRVKETFDPPGRFLPFAPPHREVEARVNRRVPPE